MFGVMFAKALGAEVYALYVLTLAFLFVSRR
jgi:hypothetical protein